MMRALEMDHSVDKAAALMKEIDTDGSGRARRASPSGARASHPRPRVGQLDFGEFCALLAKVKRGDVECHGFAKLTEDIGATPVAVLNLEVVKRGLKSLYKFVETREATAMYDQYEVMEVILSGHWFEIVDGKPRESYGDRRFQGIGKTTRDAKQNAAKTALTKLRATMPGIKFAPGAIPDDWAEWVRRNLRRGASLEDVLRTLVTKGFHPTRNTEFMQKMLLMRSFAFAFGEPFVAQATYVPSPRYPAVGRRMGERRKVDESGAHEAAKLTTLTPSLEEWIDLHLTQGYDGSVILGAFTMMEQPIDSLPAVVQRLRRNTGGKAIDVVRPEVVDFRMVCTRDLLWEAELYMCAGQDANDALEGRHSGVARTPLQLSAEHGCIRVVELLMDRRADVHAPDRLGRSPLHLAAMGGHLDVCLSLISEGGADVHASDNCQDTPLHLAAKANWPLVVHELANIEERNIREVLSGLVAPGMKSDMPNVFDGVRGTPPRGGEFGGPYHGRIGSDSAHSWTVAHLCTRPRDRDTKVARIDSSDTTSK